MGADRFAHIYGQEKVKRQITTLLQKNQLPHALLFHGEDGLGARELAFALADELTGHEVEKDFAVWRKTDDHKEEVISFNGVVFYLRPTKTQLKIDQFRQLQKKITTTSEECRVCIIDRTETMGPSIANSMLKSLEEPPANMYFILLTSEPERILPTIISRMMAVSFLPLSEGEFLAFANKEHIGADQFERLLLYYVSAGNPGLARSLFLQEGNNGKSLQESLEGAMLFFERLSASAYPYTELTKRVPSSDRTEMEYFLDWLILVARDMLVLTAGASYDLVRCRPLLARIITQVAFWDEVRLTEVLEVFFTAKRASRLNLSNKIIWDMLIMRLLTLHQGGIVCKQ